MTPPSPAPSEAARGARELWLPALWTLALAWSVVALRPAVPVDETRYLEVYREMLGNSWLTLSLNGEPYAEKTPLLFWCAGLLHAIGVPLALSLRLLPGIFSAGVVLFVERVGRRLGLASAGWVQASMLLPLLVAQLLFFDSLLAFGVVWTAWAWLACRERHAALAAGWAVLAKGPIALLFLVPTLWALAPFRARPATPRKSAAMLLASLLPLAAWVCLARMAGGAAYAEALVFGQTAGRLGRHAPHGGAWYEYLWIAPLAFLPWTPAWFVARSERLAKRLDGAFLLLLAVLCAMPSKRAFYLMPLAPLVAWSVAQKLESRPRIVRLGSSFLCLTVAGLFAAIALAGPHLLQTYGAYGEAIVHGPMWPWVGAFALAAVLCAVRPARPEARAVAVRALVVIGVGVMPLHFAAGRVLLPVKLHAVLEASGETPIATLGGNQEHLFNWLAGRSPFEELAVADLDAWCERHPDGLLLAKDSEAEHLRDLPLVAVVKDISRGKPITLYRVVSGTSAAYDRALPPSDDQAR